MPARSGRDRVRVENSLDLLQPNRTLRTRGVLRIEKAMNHEPWREGNEALRMLEDWLERHAYLVGDSFTIADITLYAYVHAAEEGGFDLKPFSGLRRWFDRIEARPAYLPIDVTPHSA